MGTDIRIVPQRQNQLWQWETVEGVEVFNCRDYNLFAWLAGVRNYAGIKPISEPRGLPDDFDEGSLFKDRYHYPISWLATDELLAVNYSTMVRNCRTDDGQPEETTLAVFLGAWVLAEISSLRRLGIERIVFGFD